MKKVLALALALVMMFAVCIPAFAIEITEAKTETIEVSTTSEAANETFTVEIPADIQVPWGTTTGIDASYTVKNTQLIDDGTVQDRLNVTVAMADGGKMTDGTQELVFGLYKTADAVDTAADVCDTAYLAQQFGAAVTTAEASNPIFVRILDFSKVSLGTKFIGHLTYTAAIEDIATP